MSATPDLLAALAAATSRYVGPPSRTQRSKPARPVPVNPTARVSPSDLAAVAWST